jgi:hypothetical protein
MWRELHLSRKRKDDRFGIVLNLLFFREVQLHECAELLPRYLTIGRKIDLHEQRLNFIVTLLQQKEKYSFSKNLNLLQAQFVG